MIISQKLVKEVNCFFADKPLVFGVDKRVPGLSREAGEYLVILGVEFDIVLVQVFKELLGAQNLGDLDQLVRVAGSMEERLFAENHGRKHRAERPHVQRIVVLLEVDEQLGPLEVSRRNPHVVLCSLVVEFGKTPVN